MSALDVQVGGGHYKLPIQPVQFFAANDWDFFSANIMKYLVRWRQKGGLADLQKSIHYAQLRRELAVVRRHSRTVRVVEAMMRSVYRWRNKPYKAPPISMYTFITVNRLSDNAANGLLYELEAWVGGKTDGVWFIHMLTRYVAGVESGVIPT